MTDVTARITQLKDLRDQLFEPFAAAQRAGDAAEMQRLEKLHAEIGFTIDLLTLGHLADAAGQVAALAAKVAALGARPARRPMADEPEPVFVADDLPENDAADAGPEAAAPTGPASASAPTVSKGWSENYRALWDSAVVREEWAAPARAMAEKMVAHQGRYAAAVAGTSTPWWFVAVLHGMECGLCFDRHLHNGDPLSARTVRRPAGLPAVGAPPFTWEESARDALRHARLTEVADWSLPSALFHWHRYNGINNAYKRRQIPTPYLWSGCQHYVKGKYVADGVFDPEAVSRQAGAATLLKALIALGAVDVGKKAALTANAAAALEAPELLGTGFAGPDFEHMAAELDFPGPLGVGDGKKKSKKQEAAVWRLQEWLNIHDVATGIDGDFGQSTAAMLAAFQQRLGRPATGALDPETWALLTAPLRRALAPITHPAGASLEEAVVAVALRHVAQKPIEVGGDNAGPWVRAYMRGLDGPAQLWCAGFVCLLVAQAARDLGIETPFRRQVGCDALAADAKAAGRFIAERAVPDPARRLSRLKPGMLFVMRNPDNDADFIHAGVVLRPHADTFDTIEGNTSASGGTNGVIARTGNRAYPRRDFLSLF